MDRFLDLYYRQAWEDYPAGGTYDYLYMGGADEPYREEDGGGSVAFRRESYLADCPMVLRRVPPTSAPTADPNSIPFNFPDSSAYTIYHLNVVSFFLLVALSNGAMVLAVL